MAHILLGIVDEIAHRRPRRMITVRHHPVSIDAD
jgi:hypothetical protein